MQRGLPILVAYAIATQMLAHTTRSRSRSLIPRTTQKWELQFRHYWRSFSATNNLNAYLGTCHCPVEDKRWWMLDDGHARTQESDDHVKSHNILERVVQGNSEIEQKCHGIIID